MNQVLKNLDLLLKATSLGNQSTAEVSVHIAEERQSLDYKSRINENY